MPIVGAVAGVAAVAALSTALFLRRRMRLHQRAKLSDVAQPASAALSAALFTQPSEERASGEPQSGEPQSGEPQSGERQSGERQSGERQSGEGRSGERQSGELSSWVDRNKLRFSFQVHTYSQNNVNVAKFEMKRRSEATKESAMGDMTEGNLAAGHIPWRQHRHNSRHRHTDATGSRGATGTLPQPRVLPPPPNPDQQPTTKHDMRSPAPCDQGYVLLPPLTLTVTLPYLNIP